MLKHRIQRLSRCVLGLTLCLGGLHAADSPNVVLIVCDDLNDFEGVFGGHQPAGGLRGWKYIPANAPGETSGMGRGANAAATRFVESRIPQSLLFHLANDPGERTNVLAENPKIAAAVQKRMANLTQSASKGTSR